MPIKAFFDNETFTLTYLVWDGESRDAVVIDPVLDYDSASSQTATTQLDALVAAIGEKQLTLRAVLETHAHADHLSGAQFLKKRFGIPVMVGNHITHVQESFKALFDFPEDFATDGSQFDRLLVDGDVLAFGTLTVQALSTPGHTPACMCFLVGDAVFTGDALFMHDYGTGRCDFPMGSARELYHSIQRLYALPDTTRVFVGHDYLPGRDLQYETTIGKSKAHNPQISAETAEDAFVAFRTKRDKTLAPPKLLYQSVQVNVDGGCLPEPCGHGHRLLRIPLNIQSPTDSAGWTLPRKEQS